MQWLIFSILAMVVVSGVRRMAREASTPAPFSAPTTVKKSPEKSSSQIQEMVQCSVCNAYLVKNAAACGKPGCPFGR